MKFLVTGGNDNKYYCVEPLKNLWTGWYDTKKEALKAPIKFPTNYFNNSISTWVYKRIKLAQSFWLITDNDLITEEQFKLDYPELFI